MRSLGDILAGLGITPENAEQSRHEFARAKSARFAALCRDGFCKYAVRYPDPPRRWSAEREMCDGWLGTEHLEEAGPLMRFRLCDRRLAWERARRDAGGGKAKLGGFHGDG